jgi:hypothetical protein
VRAVLRCCANVTPNHSLCAGQDVIKVLTKCRAKFSGAVGPLGAREIKQLDYDGFGERPLLVKPVASLPEKAQFSRGIPSCLLCRQ